MIDVPRSSMSAPTPIIYERGGAITHDRPGAITEDWTGAIIRDRQKRINSIIITEEIQVEEIQQSAAPKTVVLAEVDR